jgi:hypothetical protein
MWFAMMILFTASVVQAVKYLRTNDLQYDIKSREFAVTGIVFGILGYATGTIWMSYTWVDPNRPAYESFSQIAKGLFSKRISPNKIRAFQPLDLYGGPQRDTPRNLSLILSQLRAYFRNNELHPARETIAA